jgi:hypothetical protein
MKISTKRTAARRTYTHLTAMLCVLSAISLAVSALIFVLPPSRIQAASLSILLPKPDWLTFLGSDQTDALYQITADSSGNIYLIGTANASWGNPIRPFSTGTNTSDAFAAKLSPNGVLLWNTFLGSDLSDSGLVIAVDQNGAVYISGRSTGTWGNPLENFSGTSVDLFLAKLDSSGNLIWNTFSGSNEQNTGMALAVDEYQHIYLAGNSDASWGDPLTGYSAMSDGFLARYTSAGEMEWNTFIGGNGNDAINGIALTASGDIVVCGKSDATWGTPLAAPIDKEDIIVALLDQNGQLQWSTFLGGSSTDIGGKVAADAYGNIFITGYSAGSWGTPLHAYSGEYDMFAAKLSQNGSLIWNTFSGSPYYDYGTDIVLDRTGQITISGISIGSWGNPINLPAGNMDAFAAHFDNTGQLKWNAFFGSPLEDMGMSLSADSHGNFFLAGASAAAWGDPLNPFNAAADIFIQKISVPQELFIPLVQQ